MTRDLYNIPVELECSWLDGIIINWKIRKGFGKIETASRFARGINVPSLIDRIKSSVQAQCDYYVYLDNIYQVYYEGSCG